MSEYSGSPLVRWGGRGDDSSFVLGVFRKISNLLSLSNVFSFMTIMCSFDGHMSTRGVSAEWMLRNNLLLACGHV